MSDSLRVVLTVPSMASATGGPARTVAALASLLPDMGCSVRLVFEGKGKDDILPPLRPGLEIFRVAPSLTGSDLHEAALEALRDGDGLSVLHDNGIWTPQNHAAVSAARKVNAPYMISTHGMLIKGAMKRRWLKKRIAMLLYQKRDLNKARILHATAEEEYRHIRRAGFQSPIAIVPNGVFLPPETSPPPGPPYTALFLSRIHEIKGIDILIEAWAAVRPKDWSLLVVGPGDERYREKLLSLVRERGLSDSVSFRGEVKDDEKWKLMAESHLFVLPTRSENFGIVIAEALASGRPVITTKGAPWREIEIRNCGWWVDVSAEAVAGALAEATAAPPASLAEMGKRGRALIEEKYSWEKVAADMAAVYDWLAGGGDPPPCVVKD